MIDEGSVSLNNRGGVQDTLLQSDGQEGRRNSMRAQGLFSEGLRSDF